MKYLLTQSEDNHTIIAEVSNTHKKDNPLDHFVSKSCVDANVKSGNFTDVTQLINHDSKVWMLTEDIDFS